MCRLGSVTFFGGCFDGKESRESRVLEAVEIYY